MTNSDQGVQMGTTVYPPKPFTDLKRGQLLTLAYALEDQRDRAIKRSEDAADRIEQLCDWQSNYRGVRINYAEHSSYHYNGVCPYRAMAEVLRGNPDPRRAKRLSVPESNWCGDLREHSRHDWTTAGTEYFCGGVRE